ncbi:COR domain-containing protein [Actinoplanes rectilineatus]|uniref:COR domain-containing protein n=1 Tax=Actinoplanes rectilineatus TaxID=113571 RepID=UPI001470841A|nr:COR domain-containing protein [Actinoplanes rectilineatus]
MEGQAIGEFPPEILKIRRLHTVKMVNCGVGSVPDWIVELGIETLDLANNPLPGFPRLVLEMPRLRHLGLSGVPLGVLPDDIRRLAVLESLVVSDCQLEDLPYTLRDLANLTALDVGFNALGAAARLHLPKSLEHLVAPGTNLKVVPQSVRRLTGLRTIDVSHAGTYSAGFDPQSHHRRPDLHRLTRLSGSAVMPGRGEIGRIPDWLFDLPLIEWIDFSGQRIADLPEGVGKLTGLRGLLISGNRLTRLPRSVFEIPSLVSLNAAGNRIDSIAVDPGRLAGMSYLGLAGNRLTIPPEILSRPASPDHIGEYLARTRQDQRPLNEAKLLVVGEGSVGKSSLIRRLTRGDYDPDERKTEGIDVTRWDLQAEPSAIAVNLWDFGGQEIMHATHQFFLTRRSVYLLVVDARQSEEQNRIEYWLKLIQGLSERSPVILVGNKCEKFGLDVDKPGLRRKYPNIVDIVETSCAAGVGIDELGASLSRAIGDLKHVRDLLPASFFDVKQHLEKLDDDYLPFSEYQELCRRHGVNTAESQEVLVEFLHDLGTVLCFRNDNRLRDTNILNPSWVTGGVYHLLNSHRAAQARGLLSWADIDAVLGEGDYWPDKRPFIIAMMKKFELCYESDEVFLIPDLLTKEEPDTGSWAGSLHFTVRYGILPTSVIGRLIVRLHHLISRSTVWRTGVVLAMDNNRALIRVDHEDAVLTIKVSGPENGRRGLLTAIRAELRKIEQTLPGLAGDEQVPVPEHPGVWVPYHHLLNLEAAGREAVIPQGLIVEFPIGRLLDGVERKADRDLVHSGADVRTLELRLGDDDGSGDAGRFGLFRHPTFNGAVALISVLLTVVGLVFGYLSYRGDEQERHRPDSVPATSRGTGRG